MALQQADIPTSGRALHEPDVAQTVECFGRTSLRLSFFLNTRLYSRSSHPATTSSSSSSFSSLSSPSSSSSLLLVVVLLLLLTLLLILLLLRRRSSYSNSKILLEVPAAEEGTGVRPWPTPPSCRFFPTCSAYARDSYLKFGASKGQGPTLVHLSAQQKRFLWDRGCIQGLFRGCSGGIKGHCGVCRVYFVSETAQVELNSGRVQAPGKGLLLTFWRILRCNPWGGVGQGLHSSTFELNLSAFCRIGGAFWVVYGVCRGC